MSFKKYKNKMGISIVAGLPFILYGCANAPTPSDVYTGLNNSASRIMNDYQFRTRICAGPSHGGFSSQFACDSAAFQDYTSQMNRLHDLDLQTQAEDWAAARKTKQEIDKILAKKEKKWHIKIGDKIDIEITTTNGSLQSPQGSSSTVVLGVTPIGNPVRIVDMDWALNGSIDGEHDGIMQTSALTGTLHGLVGQSGPLGVKGKLAGGVLHQTLPSGDTVTYTIDATESSHIESDAATGIGYIDFVADVNISDDAWASVLQSSIWFHLPITVDANDNFSISTGLVSPDTFYPYAPSAYTDYNLDGIWDLATDLSAFMTDWASQSMRADINIDGLWDQADIDIWNQSFQQDALQMQ